jgi:hypothetical protein
MKRLIVSGGVVLAMAGAAAALAIPAIAGTDTSKTSKTAASRSCTVMANGDFSVLGHCGTGSIFLTGFPTSGIGHVGSKSTSLIYTSIVSGYMGNTYVFYNRGAYQWVGRYGSARASVSILGDTDPALIGHVGGRTSRCVPGGFVYYCSGPNVEALVPVAAYFVTLAQS